MSAKAKRYGKILVLLVAVLAGLMGAGMMAGWLGAQGRETAGDLNGDGEVTYEGAAPDAALTDGEDPNELLGTVTEMIDRRGRNRRVWETVRAVEVVDAARGEKRVEEQVSRIVEIGCGICYPDGQGQWQVTEARWESSEDGFVMERANYQLRIGGTLGSWLSYTVDGQEMRLRPAALKATDGERIVTLAEADGAVVGRIDPNDPRRLIFAEAFGAGVDLELEVRPDGYHQNVVFHHNPVLPATITAENAYVSIYTEIDLGSLGQNPEFDILIDEQPLGSLETLNTEPSRADIAFVRVTEGPDGSFDVRYLHRFVASKVKDQPISAVGNRNKATAYKQLYRDESGRSFLIERLEEEFFASANYPVEWDYGTITVTLDPNEDTIWYADHTYYVSSNIIVQNGTLWIEPGTFVKFAPDTQLAAGATGAIVARGLPYRRIFFGSRNDNDNGAIIPGSSGSPAAGDWVGLEIGAGSEVEYCRIRHADTSLTITDLPGIPVRHNHINAHLTAIAITDTAVDANDVPLELYNNMINGCDIGVLVDGADGEVQIVNHTFKVMDQEGVRIDSSCSHDLVIKNCLFTSCAGAGIYNDSSWYDPCNPANPSDPNLSILELNFNGYYDNQANTYGVVEGPDDVEVVADPYQATALWPVISYHLLNKNAQGGGMLADAGSCLVTDAESVYDDPCQWAIYHVTEGDNETGFTSATTITEDTTWESNYATCDTGQVAIGYHHPRIDYFIHKANVTVNGASGIATLEIKPGTVISQAVDASTGAGKLLFGANGKLLCHGDPYGEGIVRWLDLAQVSHHRFWGQPHSVNRRFVECDGPYEVTFTRFVGMGYALTLYQAEGILRDNQFILNTAPRSPGKKTTAPLSAAEQFPSIMPLRRWSTTSTTTRPILSSRRTSKNFSTATSAKLPAATTFTAIRSVNASATNRIRTRPTPKPTATRSIHL